MDVQLTGAVLVVVAQNFNPTILTQLWLVRNGILEEEEFLDGCLFLPVLSQVQSKNFNLVVIPEQLQFAPKFRGQEEEDASLRKAELLVSSLPHTPFSASGLNFTWQIVPKDGDIGSLSRKLFFREEIPIFSHFDSEDSRFGSYFSKSELGGRLKLDVKPVNVELEPGSRMEKLQFAFNFHYELTDQDKAEQLIGVIRKWRDAKILAWNILKTTIEMI